VTLTSKNINWYQFLAIWHPLKLATCQFLVCNKFSHIVLHQPT